MARTTVPTRIAAAAGGGTAAAPGGGTAATLGGGTTAALGGGTAAAPGGGTAAALDGGTAAALDGGTATAPGGGTATALDGGTATAPGAATPGGGTAAAPGGGTTATARGGTAAAPGRASRALRRASLALGGATLASRRAAVVIVVGVATTISAPNQEIGDAAVVLVVKRVTRAVIATLIVVVGTGIEMPNARGRFQGVDPHAETARFAQVSRSVAIIKIGINWVASSLGVGVSSATKHIPAFFFDLLEPHHNRCVDSGIDVVQTGDSSLWSLVQQIFW